MGVFFAVTLLGAVVVVDLSALLSGFDLVVEVGRWALAAGLCVGLVVLTIALVDLTYAIGGTPSHRARAAVTSALAFMVVMFLFVWWARHDGTVDSSLGLWLIELVGFGAGAGAGFFARDLAEHASSGDRYGDRDRDGDRDGDWPGDRGRDYDLAAAVSGPPVLGLGDL